MINKKARRSLALVMAVVMMLSTIPVLAIEHSADFNDEITAMMRDGISDDMLAYEAEEYMAFMPFNAVPQPVFSHEAGFYAADFNLTLTAPAGHTIRFTTDGSVPTVLSQEYTGPILIHSPVAIEANSPMSVHGIGRAFEGIHDTWVDVGPGTGFMLPTSPYIPYVPNLYYNAMVVRAVAFDAQNNPSATVTNTFFVENNGRGNFNTRVISIALEAEHFIDPIQGIYRNANRTHWPLQAGVHPIDGPRHVVNFEMFYPDGTRMFSQYANAWVFGNWSRRHPKRSLRFNFNQGAGDITGMYEMIPQTRRNFYDPLTTIGNFRHINARVTDRNRTGMRDSVVALMAEPLRPVVQNSTYGAVFVNGEFWGMYCLRAHRHEHLIGELYDVPRGLVQLEDWTQGHIYNAFIQGRDMSLQANFDNFAAGVDVDNFIDYFIIGYHFDNWDWISNNFEFWRTTAVVPGAYGGDGRWRFVVQDFDEGINHQANDMMQFFTTHRYSGQTVVTWPWNFGTQQLRSPWVTGMVQNLFTNAEFRNTFAARYSTYTGTVFHQARANYIIDNMVAERLPHVGADLFRWSYHNATNPTNGVPGWTNNVNAMRDAVTLRSNYSIGHIRNYFNNELNLGLDTTGFANITWTTNSDRGWFDIAGAQIRADLFERQGTHGFTIGNFNANYIRGLPIEVTAMPLVGYVFSHFEIVGGGLDNNNVTTNTMTVTPPAGSNNITVTAVFIPGNLPANITIAGGGVGAEANPSLAAGGTTVTLNAGAAPAGQRFQGWTTNAPGVTISNPAHPAAATFVMPTPAIPVTVTASFFMPELAPPSVVINHVHGNGSFSSNAISHGFIELFNPTDAAVYLGNYSLQVVNGAGANAWNVLNLTGHTIQPFSSLLVVSTTWFNDGTGGGHMPRYIIPSFDIGWNLQFNNNNLVVALVANQAQLSNRVTPAEFNNVIDLVGVLNDPRTATNYVAHYLGSNNAMRISRQVSARRTQNTRDNAADFEPIDFRYPTGYANATPGPASSNAGITNERLAQVRPRYSGDGPWGLPQVALVSVTANGLANETNTTELTLTFDNAITAAITVANITITGGVTVQAISGTGATRVLTIAGNWEDGDAVNVSVASPAGYLLSGSPQAVVLHRAPVFAVNLATASAAQNGITAAGAITPAGAQPAGKAMTITLNLAGVALEAGVHTISTSSPGGIVVSPATITRNVTPGETVAGETFTFTFTMSANAIDLDILHSFVAGAVAPDVPVTGVSTSQGNFSLQAGQNQQLTATVAPANATNRNLVWTSSNPAIATVGPTGLVAAVAPGVATITVTTADGGFVATVQVTVTADIIVPPPPVAFIPLEIPYFPVQPSVFAPPTIANLTVLSENDATVAIRRGAATVILPQSLLAIAYETASEKVSIDLSSFEIATAGISAHAMRRLAAAGIYLELILPQGVINLSPEALAQIGRNASAPNVILRITEINLRQELPTLANLMPEGARAYQVSIRVGNRTIRNLGRGTVEITLPAGAATTVWHILPRNLRVLEATISAANIIFETNELGLFVVA
ncbi:MAG: CotH kinase family protein [Defluviitaleaceae bacterium]|nr:CotH kinase family protein [Defluviitaleaceae bacterium]